MMIEHSISISEAQEAISRLPEHFAEDPTPVIVTQDGKPVMVILPFGDYERVAAVDRASEILEDEELIAAIREGTAALERGETVALEDVLREPGWDKDE